ncbi:MAG: hypothetical protein F9K24_06230 [Leptonema illini]|uniref:Lipoprotein n=1 Tax=Leptonema illini TaxID=183 RepID=A0A833H3M0_9LEPT|nr:MAG: hypothetical protein F9K24_06230 [Leptonema illini]
MMMRTIFLTFLAVVLLSACQSEREWCLENEIFFEEYSCLLTFMATAAGEKTPEREAIVASACALYAVKQAKCEAKSDCSLAHPAGCSSTFQ